jgi:putative toxin-antitoxin system antitoxin component (TIGR02293 family)
MNLVAPENIAAVLGLESVPHSFAELDDMVARGLPKHALRASVNHVYERADERRELLHRIIPEATWKRRRETLSPEDSGKAARLAGVFATAAYVWESEARARRFLTTPHDLLDGRSPLDVSMTEIGARRVEEILLRLHYGVVA